MNLDEFERFLVRVHDLHKQKGLPFDIGIVINQLHMDAMEVRLSEQSLKQRERKRRNGILKGNKLLESI